MITISMPTYRVGHLLARAVNSVLASDVDLELVVTVDGDDPQAVDILVEISDPRLRVVRSPENRGRYAADAAVLAEAKTPWFSVHDSDDWSEPDRFRRLLDASGDADAVCSPRWIHPSNGGSPFILPVKHEARVPEITTSYPAIVWNADLLRGVGYDVGYRIAYDVYLTSIFWDRYRIVEVPIPLYHSCKRPDSLTKSKATGANSRVRQRVHQNLRQKYEREKAAFDLRN